MDALLDGITSRQMGEWIAYYRLEPFGEEAANLRMATLAALIANVNRDESRRAEPYTVKDFMPEYDERPEQTDEQAADRAEAMKNQVVMLNEFFGGKRVDNR